ncbi:PRC-barrel domain-containing protein [Muricoccus aerilatus]|uniref:PRC-barrel domain-containing protein n=1 Tax=Muricoccus aerilatus TaxID=452982 RepID=UPI000693A09B|nr:PRC-barrel domain-containing protein [Roseomonas aerilata]
MTVRSSQSRLLGFTAAAALLAMGAVAQAQTGTQMGAQRDGTPGNPPSTATQRAADAATGNVTPPDGTPGNPPGTALGRAADRAGDAASGANQRAGDPLNTQNRPDGTPGNPPGTALGRVTDRALDNAQGANQRAGDPANTAGRPDGTPDNPPGTLITRGVDRALGTNTSGAFPENERGNNDRSAGPAAEGNRATVTGRGQAASGGERSNEPPAANADPSRMGSTRGAASPSQNSQVTGSGQPGAVNATPDGGQARAGTMSVPLQNNAAGNAPANPSGPSGGRGAAVGGAAAGGAAVTGASTAATAPTAQTERASRIIGSSVFNERNESIGSIDDIILAQGNSSPMAVVSVGGFLGIGAKLVAVPMSDLRWSAADNRWTITGATRESLTSLPAYSYDAARRG